MIPCQGFDEQGSFVPLQLGNQEVYAEPSPHEKLAVAMERNLVASSAASAAFERLADLG